VDQWLTHEPEYLAPSVPLLLLSTSEETVTYVKATGNRRQLRVLRT